MAEPHLTEAQRRAAARKAKILARGNAGLQRLAQTARGEEADKLYGEESPASSAPPSRPETPITASTASNPPTASTATATATATAANTASTASTTAKAPGWAPPAPTAASARRAEATQPPPMPEDMQAQFEAMMRMLGGGPGAGAGAGAEGEVPDMSNLFAQLMGGMPLPGAGGPGANLLTDSGAGTPNFSDPAQNPFANMPGFPGMPPGMGMPGMGMGMGAPPAPPSKAARFFPLLHAIAVIALVIFVAAWWEPTLSLVRWGGLSSERNWAVRWASLAGRTGAYGAKSVEPMPVFYAFVTLEAILFATRVTLVRTPPALHPLLANVLPILPPNLGRSIMAGSKYLGVASQVYADGCLFVFGLGCAIVLAEYLAK